VKLGPDLWTADDDARLARGIVRTPLGDIRIGSHPPLHLGSQCRACAAFKVHRRRTDEALFCFGCGVLQ